MTASCQGWRVGSVYACARRQERPDHLPEQEAVVSDPAQRFAMGKQIEECRAKLVERDALDGAAGATRPLPKRGLVLLIDLRVFSALTHLPDPR